MKNALILFVRNPISGNVKTRLAATIGKEKTLLVYHSLLAHTKSITLHLPVTKFVYYADFINENDLWNGYEKKLQTGNDLGERMNNAFAALFNEGYKSVCIIGSDCYELTETIIATGFEKLAVNDVVLGPVTDGGYYLLGMRNLIPDLFINKQWSTDTVFASTMTAIENLQFTAATLPMLNDIDDETDLINSPISFLLDK